MALVIHSRGSSVFRDRLAPTMPAGIRMTTHDRHQLHAIVHGLVQGVSFRYYTQRAALSLSLTGWVRNRADGTVEVMAEGPAAELERLEAFLQVGPPAAEVEQVDVTWQPATGRFDSFEIRHSGLD